MPTLFSEPEYQRLSRRIFLGLYVLLGVLVAGALVLHYGFGRREPREAPVAPPTTTARAVTSSPAADVDRFREALASGNLAGAALLQHAATERERLALEAERAAILGTLPAALAALEALVVAAGTVDPSVLDRIAGRWIGHVVWDPAGSPDELRAIATHPDAAWLGTVARALEAHPDSRGSPSGEDLARVLVSDRRAEFIRLLASMPPDRRDDQMGGILVALERTVGTSRLDRGDWEDLHRLARWSSPEHRLALLRQWRASAPGDPEPNGWIAYYLALAGEAVPFGVAPEAGSALDDLVALVGHLREGRTSPVRIARIRSRFERETGAELVSRLGRAWFSLPRGIEGPVLLPEEAALAARLR